ncbi:MAG: hypothetical protein JWO63_2622, partial [Frankiales bacterium]|nr:hypothetical protein [Frankiales bacterium]
MGVPVSEPEDQPTISACLIVRDEQGQLPSCLASLADLVDEIVVCDTGSVDGTLAVAGSGWAPARTTVIQEPWTDHFAQARNTALAHCTGEWVLSVDADEVVLAEPVQLGAVLAATPASVVAFAVQIVNSSGPDRRGLQTRYEHKLFRRSAFHWTGRVHERLERPDGAPTVALTMPTDVLRLRHDGYRDPLVVTAKGLRNVRLCELELAALRSGAAVPNEDQLAAVTLDLGRSHLAAGRPPAAQAAFEAVRGLVAAGPQWRWATDFLAWLALDEQRPDEVLVLAHELSLGGVQPAYCDWLRAQALVLRGDLA